MEKVNKVQVTVLGDKHDQAMLITTIRTGRTISIKADELADFNPSDTTSTELDNVYVAVIKRNDKYIPLNGKKFLRKLIDQGVGTEEKPLFVKLLSNIQYKKSRLPDPASINDMAKLAERFNSNKPSNQKRASNKSFNGSRQHDQRSSAQ